MNASAVHAPTRVALIGTLAVAAIAVGLLAARSPLIAVLAGAGVALLLGVVLRPELMVHVLVIVIYAGTVKISGVTIGRITAPLAVLAILVQLSTSWPKWRANKSTLLVVGAYALLAVASLAWTVDLMGSMDALGSLGISLTYLAAFGTLVRDRRQLRTLLWTIAVCSAVMGLWWIFSYLRGLDRGANPAGDPNFFSALQVVALFCIFGLIAAYRRPGRSPVPLYVIAGITVASVFSTLSRGGLLTLLVAVIMITITPHERLFGSRRHKAYLLTATAVVATVLFFIVAPALLARIENQYTTLAAGRVDLQLAAMRAYEEHAPLGVGFGGFKGISVDVLRTTPGVQRLPVLYVHYQETGLYAHNAYLGSLAELGPIGVTLFIAIFLTTARSLNRTCQAAAASRDSFLMTVSHALMLALLSFAVASLSLSSETSRSLWMLVGLSLALSTVAESPEDPEATPSHA